MGLVNRVFAQRFTGVIFLKNVHRTLKNWKSVLKLFILINMGGGCHGIPLI